MEDRIDIKISESALSLDTCYAHIQNAKAGGNVLFVGTVRDQTKDKTVTKLEFEAFETMALKEFTKIAEQIVKQWKILKVSIHHRTGTLEIGEIAVIIAVCAPHRKAAFEACEYAIDTLKETVPIWKREFFEDGAVWVAAHP